ncbi:cbb3-type cytochrome c oxidase subunit I [Bacillus sp. Marseille-Q3570]|uniref:cbb3-type cytochrome c oxidase subunit I n=1 Tax=Bacillus sp. Marseille-Q3570 TaxID=2963522 RepID=UPI0021B73488|nr:cbb3-type cytochrome c oxidase subunit I [Bacillus sp. Marseille-Q3570]
MSIKLIKISAVYFGLGVLIGMYMSMEHAFSLTPVHAHINLLGWTALTLAGIIYHLFPKAAETRLAKIHFWGHNIGLPVMMAGLTLFVYGHEQFEPAIGVGATITVISILLFVINILKNVKAES